MGGDESLPELRCQSAIGARIDALRASLRLLLRSRPAGHIAILLRPRGDENATSS
jgi:hypothetical protein